MSPRIPRYRVLLATALLAFLTVPIALAQQGGGQGPGSGGGGPGDHSQHIQYDAETNEYVLSGRGQGRRVPAAEVERSLSTALCQQCHEDAVAQLKNSVHFSVQGGNPRILFPGGGAHGALDRACGLPGTTALINYNSNVNLGECGKCHVGRFIPPMEGAFTSNFMQMFMANGMEEEAAKHLAATNAANIVNGGLDCLICHAETYLSVRDDLDWSNDQSEIYSTHELAGYANPEGEDSPSPQGYGKLTRDNTDFDHDGEYDLLVDLTGEGEPDICLPIGMDAEGKPICGWPTVGQDRSVEAVLSVGPTDEHTCLRCHEHARTGYKRGTLFRIGYDAHANVCFPNPNLTADDPNCREHNTCTSCHVTLNEDYDGDGLKDVHKFVRGHLVGGDLAAADYPPPAPGEPADPDDPTHLTCVQCHSPDSLPERDNNGVHTDTHLEKIACETCHITRSGGITYSLYGQGGHISFGRNQEGKDTKLINLDHMVADEADPGDVDADFAAYKLTPVLMWFNGSTSFLAQSLAIRGADNAKITPFKPMANGMVMDGQFFTDQEYLVNKAGFPYNAHSMYRFYANAVACSELPNPGICPEEGDDPEDGDGLYGNAEVFTALGLLGDVKDNFGNIIVRGLTPKEVRLTKLSDLMPTDPNDPQNPSRQTMAMMQAFPNLMNFSKTAYGYEHYLVSSELSGVAGGPDTTGPDGRPDGVIDEGSTYLFKMFDEEPLFENGPPGGAVNVGLMEFRGFNQPMMLPSDYSWYPAFDDVSNVATMKLPDGKFMKLFLAVQLQMAGADMATIQQLIGNYPAFSNGVTLGGHGVTPDPQQNALGAGARNGGCQQCHVAGGVLESRVPVSKEQYVVVDGFGDDPLPLPVYKWKYYKVHALIDLGLTTTSEAVVDPEDPDYPADIDIGGDPNYVKESGQEMVLNWFQPAPCPGGQTSQTEPVVCFLQANTALALGATGLETTDLTWSGGQWMPVLEPVTEGVENWRVLGYAPGEVIWEPDDPRIAPDVEGITAASWTAKNRQNGTLAISGKANGGDQVEVVNGMTDERVLQVSADADGDFAIERSMPAKKAPCTVAAKVGGEFIGEAVAVEDAPEECVGPQP